MASIIIRLTPRLLAEPNLDIRYVLPALIVERSGGGVEDDGYDYAGEDPDMFIFLTTSDEGLAVATVLGVIEHETVLGNDLRAAARVGVRSGDSVRCVYPPGSTFSLPADVRRPD